MNIRCLPSITALWLALGACIAAPKPNIVVILSDDAGYNEFSLHGAAHFPTPRIDSIAANGVKFTRGYVSGTVCSPTRAGLLTGRYQNRFGHETNIPPVRSQVNGLNLSEKTIADALRGGGYRTIAIGKWHLGYAPKFHPMERGFTDYYGFLQGQRSYFPLEQPTGLNQLLRDREPVRPEKFAYLTDELGRAAAEYIAKHKADPFFLYLAYNATHGPNHTLPEDLAKTQGGPGNAKHQAMSLALDRSVGTVLDALDRHGLTENTLVIFLNDNGGATGHDNTPLRGHKGQTWEGGVRVPFAMQWPAVLPKGKVLADPVISLDIMPTALAAAGIASPPGQLLDGVDLVPYATGKATGRPHEVLYWKSGEAWAVTEGNLKLVHGAKQAQVQLFDLAADPSETRDLSSGKTEEMARLTGLYMAWKKDFPPTPWAGGKGED